MSVFEQLCQAAMCAQEKGTISEPLAERMCAIGRDHVHYKHLGLELHGLLAQLSPVAGKGGKLQATVLDEMVQRIEDRYRRI